MYLTKFWLKGLCESLWFKTSSKHFNLVSMLPFGWYDVATSRRGTTSNQRWNNVAYFKVGIYSIEQRRINVVYFNVDMNNVDNVETTLSFSTSSFTTLVNVKTTLWIWPFLKRTKTKIFQIEYTKFKVLTTIS